MQAHQFHTLLRTLDGMQAAQTQAEGCAQCASKLDRANYRRKVRGVGRGDECAYELRDSFCCRKEGCRKRATPPSVRFLGRRVYAAVVVVLLTALQHGVTEKRSALLEQKAGVSARTLQRWRAWWLTEFVQGAFWRGAQGRFASPVDPGRLPASLLERFPGSDEERMVKLLCFLAGTAPSISRQSTEIDGLSSYAGDGD